MPNTLAYVMLLLWPLVTLAMFSRMSFERALIWSFLGAYLVLPPQQAYFNLPLVPVFDKASIPAISTIIVIAFFAQRKLVLLPENRPARWLLALFVISPVMTALTNLDPRMFSEMLRDSGAQLAAPAPGGLPGLRLYDGASMLLRQTMLLVPFLLAMQFLRTEQALRELLLALMIGGLIYSLPMLIEARFSPQLNNWVYGFFQHAFVQTIRFGGYRPMVFLPHGLWLAFFILMAVTAALALTRQAAPEKRTRYLFATLWLGVMLLFARSVGPVVLFAGLAPLVLLAGRRTQMRVAAIMALAALSYPLLRGAGLVPTETLVSLADMIDADRAGSLRFRFDNEGLLLDHAAHRALFGWGEWDRNHVFDPLTGLRLTVADGRWIIVISANGWLGYIIEFGLLTLPLVLLAARARTAVQLSPYAAALALILGANMIDLIPNATLVPLTWLLAGALLGYAETLRVGVARGRSPRRQHLPRSSALSDSPADIPESPNPAADSPAPAPTRRPRRTIL